MVKRDIQKKFKYTIMILIILICIIMLIIGALRLINRNREREGEYIRPETVNPMFSENLFKKYTGENSKEDILGSLTDFIYYIIDNKQEINNLKVDELAKRYKQNENKFKLMGISTEEDFLKIMDTVQNIDSNELKFSYASFEIDTIERLNEKVVIDFALKFVDTDEIIFKLEIENSYYTDGIIHISYK